MIALDVISDPVCPWCYIGKTRLDRAVARAGHDPFVRRWRMFRLNPDMPAEGMERRAYLEAKFGGPEGARAVYDRIAETAREDGLALDLDAVARTPQTIDAHRVLHWAGAEGVQDAVADALFRSYFERGEDVSDHAVLERVAAEAGMDAAVTRRLLGGDADYDTLAEEEAAAREMGVTGVPCFVIQGRWVVQGAQDSETWTRVIDEIGEALEKRAADAERAGDTEDAE